MLDEKLLNSILHVNQQKLLNGNFEKRAPGQIRMRQSNPAPTPRLHDRERISFSVYMMPEWNFLPEREFHSEPKPESTQSRKDKMKFVKKQRKNYDSTRALIGREVFFCMKVCKHGCDVKLLFYSRANHPSTNLKKWVENSTNLLYSPINSRSETLENLYKHAVYCFKREKPLFWKASFIVKLITHTSFVYKTARLVTLLISNLNKEFPFFSRKLFYKSKSGLVIKPRADGHDIVWCNVASVCSLSCMLLLRLGP